MRITEKMLTNMIMETVSNVINEGNYPLWDKVKGFAQKLADKDKEFITGREQLHGAPTSASQVMSAAGWKGVTLKKLPNGLIIQCYTKGTAMGSTASEIDELADDLNQYYASKNLPIHAEGFEDYDGQPGAYLKVTKQ